MAVSYYIMYKKCNPVSHFSSKVLSKTKKSAKKGSCNASPNPRANPFISMNTLDKLPRLRPISPTILKMPKEKANSPKDPSRLVSLKILPRSKQQLLTVVSLNETPTFIKTKENRFNL